MSEEPESTEEDTDDDLESLGRSSLIEEFAEFLKESRKWWMIPILAVFALFAILLILVAVNPAIAPFVYTLF